MAMPNKVKVFSRDYSGGQAASSPRYKARDGDVQISRLWEAYSSTGNNSTQWSFRKQVFPVAKRLLSRQHNWFQAQDRNRWLQDYNYQFIVDTLRFIGTGRRRINIHAWGDLVTNQVADHRPDVSARHDIADIMNHLKLSHSVNELIAQWCSHPGGFDDMMVTLNVLFGDGHILLEDPDTTH